MRVLLIYPNIYGMNMLPPAIGLFTALLRQHGHEVELFDSTTWKIPGEDFDSDKEKEKYLTARPFDDSKLHKGLHTTDVFDDFTNKINAFKPDLLAASVVEDLVPVLSRLLSHVQDRRIPTIVGGVFATFAPDKTMNLPGVDMVCIGEGERVLVELCRRMEAGADYSDIPGLWVRKGTEIVKNPMAPPVDVNKNPRIDLSLFDESRLYRPMQGKVWRMLPVETHRGCPYQCTYCNSPAQRKLYRAETNSSFCRKKDFASIREEMLYYRDELKAEALYFWADTFLAYTQREFDQFCEIYEDIRLPFWCQSRPETVRLDRIKRLMDLGLFRMSFGIEHGDETFRKKVLRRNISNQTIVERLGLLNTVDLKFSVNNIMGFPTETRELAFQTIELNRKVKSDNANAYSYSPFHGTYLRDLSEKLGYCPKDLIARSAMKPTLLDMPDFPPEAIEGLRRCFSLYVLMPRSRFKDIARAEKLTPEGDSIWAELREECLEKYTRYD